MEHRRPPVSYIIKEGSENSIIMEVMNMIRLKKTVKLMMNKGRYIVVVTRHLYVSTKADASPILVEQRSSRTKPRMMDHL